MLRPQIQILKRSTILARSLLKDVTTGQLLRDLRGASSIAVSEDNLADCISCQLAPDLMVQDVDPSGTIWATQGYHLYRLDGTRFCHDARLPCPWGKAALGYSSAIRRSVRKSPANVFALKSGTLLVLAGGYLYRKGTSEKSFARVFRLRYSGPGVGRGILSRGLVHMTSGRILFGEYFRNPNRGPVHVYGSDDDGRNWTRIYCFASGSVRHIHALCEDEFTDDLWICTGDTDDESMIARSSDQGNSFDVVGKGSQSWRTCGLMFDEKFVYWGADTSRFVEHRNIYRMRRENFGLEPLASVDGAIEYGLKLADDLFVFGTTRSRFDPGWDDSPSIWVGDGHQRWVRVPIGPWLEESKPLMARMEMVADSQHERIAITFENIARYDQVLMVISFSELRAILAQ